MIHAYYSVVFFLLLLFFRSKKRFRFFFDFHYFSSDSRVLRELAVSIAQYYEPEHTAVWARNSRR